MERDPAMSSRARRRLTGDARGAVLVEAAIALPILITLLLGIVTYAAWFMAAHSLQEAANDAARAALAGIDGDERQQLVDQSVANSVIDTGTLNADLVTVTTAQDASYYKVTLRYDAEHSALFASALVPLPAGVIRRTAVVQLSSP
jgi:Flp pilus assembly protein TadG